MVDIKPRQLGYDKAGAPNIFHVNDSAEIVSRGTYDGSTGLDIESDAFVRKGLQLVCHSLRIRFVSSGITCAATVIPTAHIYIRNITKVVFTDDLRRVRR